MARRPRPMQKRASWRQHHSDLLAQFLDVASLISNSTWHKSPTKFNIRSNGPASLPSHESLIFAALYFRQLFGGDGILSQAVKIHRRFSESQIRVHWIEYESSSARECWTTPLIELTMCSHILKTPATLKPTLNELFDAFLYGAHVLYGYGKSEPANVLRLRQLLNTYPKNVAIGCLHGGLMTLHNYVANISVAIEQDFRVWFHTEKLPRPEIHWQGQLFGSDGGNFSLDR